jgi:hypothetical protein
MEPRFSIFQSPLYAFFSREFYDDVARRWRGLALGYLLLLLGLTWLIALAVLYSMLVFFLRGEGAGVIDQFPDVTVKDGTLTMDRPSPYDIRVQSTGQLLVRFDTRAGAATQPDNTGDAQPPLLVTDRQLIYRDTGATLALRDAGEGALTAADVHAWVDKSFGWTFLGWSVILVLVSCAFRVAQVMLYGAAAMALAAAQNKRLDFPAGVRLAAASITPVIVLDTILSVLFGPAAWLSCVWWVITFLMGGAYLAFAVKSVRVEEAAPLGTGDGSEWDQRG